VVVPDHASRFAFGDKIHAAPFKGVPSK